MRFLIVLITALILNFGFTSQALAQHEAEPTHAAAEQPSHDQAATEAATEHAGEHGEAESHEGGFPSEPKEGIMPFVAALIVFGLVMAVLGTKVWPKILQGLTEREQKIKSEIESAEAARRQANEALEEYQKNLTEARAEAARMIEQTKQEQRRLAEELRAKSERELSEMKKRATQEIEAAKRSALTEIYTRTAVIATEVAGKILQREINPEDHKQLVQDAIGKLSDISRN